MRLAVLGLLLIAAGAPRVQAAPKAAGGPAVVAVSYADLVDPGAVIRTGERLEEAARDAGTPRAFLQPFFDGHSSLLPYAVEMLFGPDPVPRRDIVERWPPGSPQPAWVALFRGRYRAVSDGKGGVRLFLPGEDAAAAWREHYPAVRHALAALAGEAGVPLAVEVFAYRNDYRRRELRLMPRPATVRAAAFPPDRPPLDLGALEDFFRLGAQLEGVQLDPDEGLVLFAKPGRRDTLGGEAVSLADFAAAYRAVFHAGDNDAFVSLDPNADPTLVSVDFGGYLEDTRIGAAILAADRRFKTICSGLDPITHEDARAEIRRRIPEFMTNSERGLLDLNPGETRVWKSSRFWFYPESVSVDEDPRERVAVITRPRFTADAERTGPGFEGAAAGRRRAALHAGTRENIRQLNADHERYAAAFPEIGDLAAVARLMAVAVWLRRSETSRLDLDALLAVPLPAVSTPRSLEQIVSTEYVAVPPGGKVTAAMVRDTSGVIWLTPVLQRTVEEVFREPKTLAGFLCARRTKEGRPCADAGAEAALLFAPRRGQPVRSLLRAGDDLIALLELVWKTIPYPFPPEGEAERARQLADVQRLRQLRAGLQSVQERIAASAEPAPEPLAAERARLEGELAAIMKSYHERMNGAAFWKTRSRLQVSGGISLRPGEFGIRANPGSAALQEFKRQARSAGVAAGPGGAGANLVRSRPTGKMAPPAAPARPASSGRGAGAPASRTAPPVATAGERRLPGVAAASIALPAGAAGVAPAVGEMAADGRIVFRRSSP